MKKMTEAQIVDLRVQLLVRAIQLNEENEKLKKEVKSRRRQADAWRKRCLLFGLPEPK